MEILILIVMILVLAAMLVLCGIVLSIAKKNQEQNTQVMLKNQESILTSNQSDQKIFQRFEILLNQVQQVQRSQATVNQSMDWIQNQMESINQVMTNTKRRGNWGEYQLDLLLQEYAGENNKIYTNQYTLPNGKIADVAFHMPGTEKVLCIDSKFPMENYLRMDEETENKETYYRAFRQNIKKHIDDIANKYINEYTTSQAILFIPSEAIYQFICAKCDDILSYALQKHVMLTSPTTLIGIVFTLNASTQDFYQAHHMEEIEKNILSLKQDVERLVTRSEKAQKSLESLVGQFQLVSTSANKISQRMNKMMQGDDIKYDEHIER